MKRVIFIFLFIFHLTACDDLLTEEPLTVLTPGAFYSTATGIETAVNAAYSFLKPVTAGRGSIQMVITTLRGSDIFRNGAANKVHDSFLFSPTDNSFTSMWVNNYKGINVCNNVTDFIGSVTDMTPELKNIREGEARFIRAYFYYMLTMHFGSVHLTLNATQGIETAASPAPIPEIFDAIKADLEFAVANLPDTQPDYGRIDVHGAKHFLAYVLLSDSRSTAADFQRAATLAKEVIDNSGRVLLPTRAAVFDENNERHNEILFSVQFVSNEALADGGNEMHLFHPGRYEVGVPGVERSMEYMRPYQVVRPTQFMLDLYDETIDSRYTAFWQDVWYANVNAPAQGISIGDTAMYFPKRPMTKEQIDSKNYLVFNPESSANLGPGYTRVQPSKYPNLKKFYDTKRASINATIGSRDWIVFRLAETYLIASEAYMRAGDLENAVTYMNVLRRAAALPGKEAEMEITEADLTIDFILDERARELCGELQSRNDLVRTGKFFERVNAHNLDATGNVQPFHQYRPIPQIQIDRTSNGFPQNEGY